jgi:hypothetical protein
MDATAFTLPPGYRPSKGLTLPLGYVNGGTTTIGTDGGVAFDCGGTSGCPAGIDGLSFRVP